MTETRNSPGIFDRRRRLFPASLADFIRGLAGQAIRRNCQSKWMLRIKKPIAGDSAICNIAVAHVPAVSEFAYFKAPDGQPSSFLASRRRLKSTISVGAMSFSILLLILTNSMLREIPFSLTSPFWLYDFAARS